MGSPGTELDVDLDASSGRPNDAYDSDGWQPNRNDVCTCIYDILYELLL